MNPWLLGLIGWFAVAAVILWFLWLSNRGRDSRVSDEEWEEFQKDMQRRKHGRK